MHITVLKGNGDDYTSYFSTDSTNTKLLYDLTTYSGVTSYGFAINVDVKISYAAYPQVEIVAQ